MATVERWTWTKQSIITRRLPNWNILRFASSFPSLSKTIYINFSEAVLIFLRYRVFVFYPKFLQKFMQALFNLANIMEVHGDVVTNDTLLRLSLPKEAFISPKDTIVHLYKKYVVKLSDFLSLKTIKVLPRPD